MLRYLTAGESHGQGLVGIIEGLPAGLKVDKGFINNQLKRRQSGFGRGRRMKIEEDKVEIISGLRHSYTLGSPIAILIKNRDWENWEKIMHPWQIKIKNEFNSPRPGHADLSGAIKFNTKDIRNVLERASARETAMRVALGAISSLLLKEFQIEIMSHIIEIGGIVTKTEKLSFEELIKKKAGSALNCAEAESEERMKKRIREAELAGDTLGGRFEVRAKNVPVGLGSFIQWDKRLDGRLAQALMSIPAIKAVEIGQGFNLAKLSGSQAHDEIFYQTQKGFFRKTNRAGGIEGGISNGEEIIVRAVMKPIPSLKKPLNSVNLISKKVALAQVERGDICALPAASVVGEAMVSLILADSFLEKFSGDHILETKANFENYRRQIRKF